MKKIAFALLGAGGLLFLLGLAVLAANSPDFEGQTMRTLEGGGKLYRSNRDSNYERMAMETARRSDRQYWGCLFSSSGIACENVQAVPFLSFGGILLLVAGGGLFMYDRRTAGRV